MEHFGNKGLMYEKFIEKGVHPYSAEGFIDSFKEVYENNIVKECGVIETLYKEFTRALETVTDVVDVSNINLTAKTFFLTDINLTEDIANAKKKLELIVSRYEILFGEYPDKERIKKHLPRWESRYHND